MKPFNNIYKFKNSQEDTNVSSNTSIDNSSLEIKQKIKEHEKNDKNNAPFQSKLLTRLKKLKKKSTDQINFKNKYIYNVEPQIIHNVTNNLVNNIYCSPESSNFKKGSFTNLSSCKED